MLQTVPSSVTLLSLAEDKTSEGEAWVNGIFDIDLSQKNHLERVKIGGIFPIGSVWITEFPITLASASVQKCPKKMSLPMCSSGRQGFF